MLRLQDSTCNSRKFNSPSLHLLFPLNNPLSSNSLLIKLTRHLIWCISPRLTNLKLINHPQKGLDLPTLIRWISIIKNVPKVQGIFSWIKTLESCKVWASNNKHNSPTRKHRCNSKLLVTKLTHPLSHPQAIKSQEHFMWTMAQAKFLPMLPFLEVKIQIYRCSMKIWVLPLTLLRMITHTMYLK